MTATLPDDASHRRFLTSDLDEARQTFARLHQAADLHPLGRRFAYEVSTVSAGPVAIHDGRWPHGGTLRTDPTVRYNLLIPRRSGLATTRADSVCTAGVGDIACFGPGAPVTCRFGEGLQIDNISFDMATLKRHILALGGSSAETVAFKPVVDRTTPAAGRIAGLAAMLRAAQNAPAAVRVALGHALLTAVVSELPHSAAPLLERPAPRVTPGVVRRAEAWMEAHLHASITITDVATAVGVSARSLQQAFTTYRERPPMAFLKEQRLLRARVLLATGECTVARVAELVGMPHLGRFAAAYRERFGEPPHVALTQGRGGQRP